MNMRNVMVSAVVGMLFASGASAEEAKIGDTGYLRSSGGMIGVFKTQDAMSKFFKLRDAGADNELLAQQVACIVPDNTKVLVTADITGGFWSGAGAPAMS